MKRMLALFLAVLLLTGCTAKTAKREPDKERETETIAVTDAKVGSSQKCRSPKIRLFRNSPRFPLRPRSMSQLQKQRHRNHPAYTLEVLTRINTTIRVAALQKKSSQRMKSGSIAQKMHRILGIRLVEAATLNNIIAKCLHPKIEKRKIRWTL